MPGNCALTLESAASVDAPEGETHWKLIGLHHYLPRENQGMPSVFIEVLDEAGQRVSDPVGRAMLVPGRESLLKFLGTQQRIGARR